MNSPKSDDNQTEGSASGDKIRIKFIFANRDGITVEIECSLSDSVDMVKNLLIAEWPTEIDEVPPKADRIRLICMGKGILGPDQATIEQCDLPVFLTHPTPVNVSVKPVVVDHKESRSRGHTGASQNSSNSNGDSTECCCVVS
mmetsp:Transcript_21309/g.31990  ORF Transcript_21309/g.31990 Transcript_21309/m.31990 type:complete len:143 (-) Transcript_21309:307-735(-)